MFNKVLIANRGEIAVRIIRSAQSLGYRTVAVFSEADSEAPHVSAADEAVCIGAAAVGESYLVAEKLIDAAKKTGADAIHPGYGFLSENSGFAKACEESGITFIGPRSHAIDLMGSKRQSKIAMIEAGVPCIPGYEGADQSDDVLKKAALDIGMPVMLKASAGGGGRGMRLVTDETTLDEHIRSARSEAQNAFGSGELIIEKAVMQPRHIEIQVFADTHGNVVYLGERDCSVQRRHQKVIEEAPSPFVSPELRKAMGEAAVNAAKSCDYVGAGTVEFLADSEGNFYFLEMNTRLQVEHPVTELITGLDLVAMQLKVAAGDVLPVTQEDVTLTGHAMEVRLYAEDPGANFVPQTGKLHLWQPAEGEGVRIDSGIKQGQEVSSFYDPMLAKLITYGANREEARRRLIRVIEDSHLLGIKDNRAFLASILRHDAFIQGEATTAFIGNDFADDTTMQPAQAQPEQIVLAAALLCASDAQGTGSLSGTGAWHNNGLGSRYIKLAAGETTVELNLTQHDSITVEFAGSEEAPETQSIRILERSETAVRYEYQGIIKNQVFVVVNEQGIDTLHMSTTYGNLTFSDLTYQSAKANQAGSDQILASMDGAIVEVLVNEGDEVEVGQTLVVLEAMKMEHPLKAEVAGKVANINVVAGDQVKGRQKLIQLQANEE